MPALVLALLSAGSCRHPSSPSTHLQNTRSHSRSRPSPAAKLFSSGPCELLRQHHRIHRIRLHPPVLQLPFDYAGP